MSPLKQGLSPPKWGCRPSSGGCHPLNRDCHLPDRDYHPLNGRCHLLDKDYHPLCLHTASSTSPSSSLSPNGLCHVPSGSEDICSPLSPCGHHCNPKEPLVPWWTLLCPHQAPGPRMASAMSPRSQVTPACPRPHRVPGHRAPLSVGRPSVPGQPGPAAAPAGLGVPAPHPGARTALPDLRRLRPCHEGYAALPPGHPWLGRHRLQVTVTSLGQWHPPRAWHPLWG